MTGVLQTAKVVLPSDTCKLAVRRLNIVVVGFQMVNMDLSKSFYKLLCFAMQETNVVTKHLLSGKITSMYVKPFVYMIMEPNAMSTLVSLI